MLTLLWLVSPLVTVQMQFVHIPDRTVVKPFSGTDDVREDHRILICVSTFCICCLTSLLRKLPYLEKVAYTDPDPALFSG